MDEQRSITLIGMPAVGKTKIGEFLAEILKVSFVDTDDVIVRQFKAGTLQQVVDTLPPEEFAAIEESIGILTALTLLRTTIIATSGSMVYAERAMRYFRDKTHVVYLEASLPVIERRISRRPNRGIVFAPGETLRDLYDRRVPLYEQWAHRTVNADSDHRRKLAEELATLLKREGIA